jgi:thiol:disulfide interchange protein DsbA
VRRTAFPAFLFGFLLCCAGAAAQAQALWTEGVNYFRVPSPQPSPQPDPLPRGKVEVTEFFSYGCPACNAFQPIMHKLEKSVPGNVVVNFVPAAFNPSEDWVVFQQAYYAALTLGIAAKTHDAMFEAVWSTGELATVDPSTHQLKNPLPTLENVAAFYHKAAGIPAQRFIDTAKSFGVYTEMQAADAAVMAYQVDRTPTIIVAGKYRVNVESAGGADQLIAVVNFLVAKESK